MGTKNKTSGEMKLDGFFKALSADLDVLDTRRDIGEKRLFSVSRLRMRMRKRAQYIRPDLVPKCIDEFLSINEDLSNVKISLEKEIVENAREFIENALMRYTYSVEPDNYGCLSMKHIFDLWKFGPGASQGTEHTHTALKIRQKMSCTSLSEPIVKSLRACNPYFNAFDCANDGGTVVVIGSGLTTAPKNEDTVRIIAKEPSGNMALQLAAGRYLEGALRYIGLDIKTQEAKNKLLALLGSVTGGIATLDLSKASDRILVLLIRMLFPARWFKLLYELRCSHTEIPERGVVQLNMMSTMGNGFTFPMMTLMLVALVYANRAVHHKLRRRLYVDWSLTAVYGDDIIVPTHEAATLVNVLHQAGLVVNTDKSYTDGPFRESCGGDYYKGWDVLPFYVETLTTPSEVYVALNKMTEWCCRNELVLFQSTKYLLSLLPGPPLLVPEWHNPNEGWLCTQVSAKYKYISTTLVPLALCDSMFDMSLAIGGYIQQRVELVKRKDKGKKNDQMPHVWGDFKPVEMGATRVVCFEATCRESPTVVRLRSARLPRGYLDGRDAVKRDVRTSAWAQLIVSLAA